MINPHKVVDWYKQRYSAIGESDYDIYEKVKQWYPEKDYAENPFATKPVSTTPTEQEIEEKTNPGAFEKLLTANLADAYAADSDWWAEAYNKSIAGTLYQAIHGEAKYDVDEVDRKWYDEAGQFFVGLVSPIDMLTFFGSSGVGSVAAKGITAGPLKNYAIKGLSKMMQQAGVSRVKRKAGAEALKKAANTKFGKYLASSAAIESGFSLGTYGAAGAALQDQAQQSTEIKNGTRAPGDRDYLQTTWAAVKHGTSSAILGAGAGFVTKGLMAPKFARTKIKNDPLYANKITRLTMNPVGQVAAEGTVFGTGQIAERALMGEDVDMDDWLSSIFMNTAIVGGLRASMKPLRMGEGDYERYQKARKAFYGGVRDPKTGKYTGGIYSDINNKKAQSRVAKELETKNKVVKTLEDEGIPAPKELLESIAKLEAEADNMVIGLDAFGKNLKNYNKLLKKMEELPNMTPEEQVKLRAQILKDTGAINLSLYHFYSEMQTDRAFGYQVYKDYFGKEPLNNKQKKEIDLMIDQKVKDMEDVNFMINQGSLNNPEAIKMAQDKYLTGFDVAAKEIKNKDGNVIGYETELRTPDGSKVQLTKAVRTKKTEAEALKFGEELKETYIKGLKGEELEAARAIKADVEVVKYTPIKDGIPEIISRPKKGEEAIGGMESVPVIKEGTKAEVDKMVKEGRAKVAEPEAAPIASISDPSKKVPVSSLEAKVEEMHSMLSGQQELAPGVPIKKAYYEKLSKEYNDFITTEKGQFKTDPHKNRMKKEIWESGEAKDIINSLSGNEFDMIAAYKMAESLYAKELKTSPQANTKLAIKLIGYLNSKGKNIYELNPTELSTLIKEGIPSFKITYVKDGREITKTIQSSQLFNSGGLSSLRQIIASLRANEFISGDRNMLFESIFSTYDRILNENRGKGIEPAKEGVRKNLLKRAKQLSETKKDEGYNIAAQLASKFYVRDQEINKINAKNIKEVLKKEGDEYYLDMSQIKKYKTADRIVWIDKELGMLMEMYDGNLSSKKYVTEIAKLTPSNNKKRLTDTRRRAQTIAGNKLDGPEYRKLNWLLGHDESAIKQIYDVANIKDVIASQKELHKKINSPISELAPGRKRDFRIISGKDVPAPKDVHLARKSALMKRYSEVAIQLVKDFKDKKIPEDAVGYLEKVENWVIKVKTGRAPSDTIPHEVAHYVFKLLDATKKSQAKLPKEAKKTMKLYDEATKLFVGKDGKFSEESAVTMIGKAIDKQLDSPTMAKATGFFKRFNRWLKSVFNKPLSKEEVAYALGERIIRRKGIVSKDITGIPIGKEFRRVTEFASPGAFSNFISRNVREVSKKHGFKSGELVEFVAREAGIQNPKKFTIGLPPDKLSIAHVEKVKQLESFYNTFEQVIPNVKEYIGKKDALQRFRLITKIERTRAFEKGITKAEQQRLLEAMGVEGGDIRRASIKKLKAYDEYVTQQDAAKRDNLDLITVQEINDIHMASKDASTKAFVEQAMKEGNLFFGTVHSALDRIGFKKLSEKLKTHYSLQESNSSGLLRFNEKASEILGGNYITKEARLSKMKNNMVVSLDNNGEMLLGYMGALKEHGNKLPKGDAKRIRNAEAYFRKAIKPEWWKTVKNGRGDGLAKKNKDGSWKYINLETKEGRIAQEYINNVMNSLGRDKFESALRQRTNQAEYERIMDTHGIKFIRDGIYMTRIISNEGKRLLQVVPKAKERAVEGLTYDIATDMAKKKYGKKYKKENVNEFLEDARIVAEMKFNDLLYFNPGKISIKYLKDRYSLQELYVQNEKGKLSRTYEWEFDKTVTPYVQGMSKFYATLEMFPEAIDGMKPGSGIHQIFSGVESTAKGASLKTIGWAKDVVNKQLGFEKSGSPYELVFRASNSTARVVAKLGLSFPTAGAKNIVTGTTQTVFAHRVRDIARGFGLVLSRDAEVYNRALDSNAYSVGNILYEGATRIDRVLDATAFKAGFMRPTEKFNRLLAIAASISDQRRQFERLSLHPKGSPLHSKALDRLKSFYFLTDKEIAKRMKYETVTEIKMDKNLTDFQKAQMMRDINAINNKMNTYAHVNTQGSSADLFMPRWAGHEGLRPLTLFKRMAYAATDNTIRNVKYSGRQLKKGDASGLIRPIMGLTATYLSGSAMLGIYSSLLGTSMPKENSDWWARFKVTMWKGEFLGIMSESLSPYDEGFTNTIHPAIFNTISSMFMETGQLLTGKSTFKQAGDGLMRSTFSAYNSTKKIIERRYNDLNRDKIRFGKLHRDYLEEMGKPMPKEMERSIRSPYYEDFDKFFYLGKEEEFAKQLFLTFFAVAHDEVRKGIPRELAFKKANAIIKGKLTSLNPNKGSLAKGNEEGLINSANFIKWLQKHPDAKDLVPRMFEIEVEYKARLKKYMSMLGHYAKKNNVASYYDDFDWTLRY